MKKKSSFHPALNPFLYYATSKARIRFWVQYTQNTTNSLCCFLSVIYGADAYLSQPWPKNPTESPIFLDQQSFAYFWKSHTRKKNCKFLVQSNHCMQCENSPKILVHFKVSNVKNVRNWFLYSVIKYFEYSQKRANIFCYFYFDIGIQISLPNLLIS